MKNQNVIVPECYSQMGFERSFRLHSDIFVRWTSCVVVIVMQVLKQCSFF